LIPLRAVQLLLGHRRLEGITRCLGVAVEHIQDIAEETDV
jgi:site-specific recombinase XerD